MDANYWRERCLGLEARVEEQEKEIKELNEQLEAAESYSAMAWTDKKALKTEIEGLKATIKQNEPLLRVGVAVRLRYLEQAKAQVIGLHPSRFNTKLIHEGNQAAHEASGLADVALLTGDNLRASNNERARLEAVFRALYGGSSPQEYVNLSPKMSQAIDHKATISSLYSLNDNAMTLMDRQAASDSMDIIRKKHSELNTEEFEINKDVSFHLERLGGLADDIVKKSRIAAPNRNGGAFPNGSGPPLSPNRGDRSNARRHSRGGRS